MASPVLGAEERYTTAVKLRWPYAGDSEGMRTPEEESQMAELEQAVSELTARPGVCYLMMVSSGSQIQEWMYYAVDEAAFMGALNKCLAGRQKYPLTILADRDDDWSYWREWVQLPPRTPPDG
jgi:hypothetical protein